MLIARRYLGCCLPVIRHLIGDTFDAALEKGESLISRKAADVEPAAGDTDGGAGYKREDRARLERLIREGASDR